MNAKSVPLPTPEDLATERLVTAIESAIDTSSDSSAFAINSRQNAPAPFFTCWVDNPQK